MMKSKVALLVICVFALASPAFGDPWPTPRVVTIQSLQNHPTYKAGYIDATWYNNYVDEYAVTHHIVGDGVTDCTTALNKALEDAHKDVVAVYLPQGTYRVTNTVYGTQRNPSSTACTDYYWGVTPEPIAKYVALVGDTRGGTKPVIRLDAGAAGFGNPAAPKAVIHFRNVNDNPDHNPFEGEDPGCGFGLVIRGIKVHVEANNPGAVAFRNFSAQFSYIEDVEADLSHGGYAGIRGAPSTSNNSNIVVTGGQYGIIPIRTNGTFSNVVLTGQTTAAIRGCDSLSPSAVNIHTNSYVGFRITKENGPAIITNTNTNNVQSNHMTLYDGSIEITGGSTIAVNNDTAGANLVLKNVYIKNPGALLKSKGHAE